MKRKTALLVLLSILLIMPAGCGKTTKIVSEKIDRSSASDSDKEDVSEEKESAKEKEPSEKGSEDSVSSDAAKDGDGKYRLVRTYFDQSKSTESGGYTYFQCFGDHIICSLETETEYPKLAKALRELSEKEESEFREEIKKFDRDAFEYEESVRSSGGTGYYYHYASDLLKRADEKCVSIVRVLNGYLGGAHPDYYYETYNFDPSTGERIVLADVVANKEKLNEILEKKLLEDYPDVEFFGLKDSLAEYDMTLEDSEDREDDDDGDHSYAYSFSLDPDGVSFYFSPYGISAYAYGDQVVKILYDEEPSLFTKDYSSKGGYVSFLTDYDNKYSIESIAEKLKVEMDDYDVNNYFHTLDIYKGKQNLKLEDVYYYNQASFMVDNTDDKKFLYIFGAMDNDYKELTGIDLNGNTLEEVQLDPNFRYCYSGYYDEASGIYGVVLPLYPDNMELGVHCDLLSTYTASGYFEVLDNGRLKLKDKYLIIPEGVFVLTAKQEFKADVVDEDGIIRDKDVAIPKGSELTLLRTDGVAIVDATLSDGRIIRLNLDGDFPHKVNNSTDAETLFDGMMFAG